MSLHPHSGQPDLSVSDILAAIDELKANTTNNIQSRRVSERLKISAPAILLPGNLSDRDGRQWDGLCHDVSPTGCRLVLDQPLHVGDIYFLEVQDQELLMDPLYVRCIRCHMIRENSYECGVAYFSRIDMINPGKADGDEMGLDIG